MLKLFLIRHGETDFNRKNIVQGKGVNSELNETGKEQARKFFETYRHIPFKALYASTLIRSYQTLQPFTQIGYGIEQHPGLDEISWGDLEGKPANPEIRHEFDRINHEWSKGNLEIATNNGENPIDVWNRFAVFLNYVETQHPNGGNLLICTHGRTLRILLCGMLGYGLHNMSLFEHHNTGLNLLIRQPNAVYFAETLNDLAHLQ